MNTWLWAGQIVLAASFVLAGIAKVAVPKDNLRNPMPWVDDLSQRQVTAIGALEILGGASVILPWATNIAPILTPLAAVGLALVMIGGFTTHIRRNEYTRSLSNIAFFAIAVLVAIGRFS
ncbi:putative membrane protein YphA (DoxX/SURF4 family) [Nocardia transvalensis]|uniref:Putative membrane protein YphA (DoxX/SURF4 family) n=1 Tax=Nocardia transvalensis TaxID=37333 RepID=A0A7W9PL46_9NOCA|nr:DoxX family protein [Nocardia transvalensis]MBB5918127.1 putative membrane protein YphA (DoxX/SURF4 family) [Nocardia transvalensis]